MSQRASVTKSLHYRQRLDLYLHVCLSVCLSAGFGNLDSCRYFLLLLINISYAAYTRMDECTSACISVSIFIIACRRRR